ncbi:MAG: PqiC family protein [Desulfobacterales bacterium]
MSQRNFFTMAVWIGLAAVLATGCAGSSPRSKYYLLSALPETEAVPAADTAAAGISLGIGPVSLPDYLDRPQIVMRTGPNEVSFSEFDRWAEPLPANFLRVFRQDLADLLKTDSIFIYPWAPGAVFEFQVSAEVARFDARPGAGAWLEVQWQVRRHQDGQVVLTRSSSYHADLDGSDVKAVVAAQSRTLGDFSRDVAQALTAIYRQEHGR